MTLAITLDQAEQAAIDLPSDHGPAKLPVPTPTPSFWINSPHANPFAKEGSTGELTNDADVCIIGSGITGVSVAYHISNAIQKRGACKVVILEARDFC